MTARIRRLKIEIHGAVQGVGFRPFVYRLATELTLTGWVINDTQGVFIEVEGSPDALESFLNRLPDEKPPLAIIHSLDSEWLAPLNFKEFKIRHSDAKGAKTALILPDVATCSDCLSEVFDSDNRRHRYPFTNCTNCGPRFTIIQELPYDRPNTTMRRFIFCPDCKSEYENPLDRRFHAQPNACPVCGPSLAFWEKRPPTADRRPPMDDAGNTSQRSGRSSDAEPFSQAPLASEDAHSSPSVEVIATKDDALGRAAEALKAGQIVAVKGLGGFHLMVDARNTGAIARLRERKPRRDKPFAVMVRDLAQAKELCEIRSQAEALLTSPESPIVLLPRRPRAPIAGNVAPGNPNLGIMLPYTPLHHLLMHNLDGPLVATSGNLSDEPICTDENEALQRLGQIADCFLVHNRPIERHVDDSVACLQLGKARLLRRARGYAPLPIMLPQKIPTILAVGAQLKNTVALSVNKQVFISQHIGDLETMEAMAAFERVIADFLRLYEAAPVAIAHDMHPDYLATLWVQQKRDKGRRAKDETGEPFVIRHSSFVAIPVQHHHAHLAACLAENGADGPALGVTWDGTGYGADGAIWGGEFLLGDAADFERVAHLRPFRLPGGDAAVKEPRRTALALLWELYGEAALERGELIPIQAFKPVERRLLGQMLMKSLNAPLTTSAGRLFDGVAALVGLHQQVSFEGQAAMALEYIADKRVREAYPFPLTNAEGGRRKDEFFAFPSPFRPGSRQAAILNWGAMLESLLQDLQQGVEPAIIAARFHNGLIEGILAVAELVGESKVALTGGCFQNRFLTERAALRLRQAGFEVLLHRQVPPNDGGISLGQIAVAAARLQGAEGGE